ncbi:carboxylate/amino acid/amine transporter [Thalassovita gelatinovora]|uniref:Carboxylate/amino acid/amine transporter n=1 Tax=Thalassovita gelatinovora TaxID=53501 RepID=A0A0P1FHG9_THAGE|nr:DMT family transporter [Thalassovita gelatinovora]QIZ81957.1 DMT family transporter [Thalassovita gelatinovora]CUH67360.1 carboxylate/amino acid/amine transporter [Thalassovita gelatinovora]SEP75607.1 EamA-like transporter family protein [Thalassovita gelatinovora]
MTTSSPSQVTGYAAAWSIVFVWSFWLIVSRVANESGLTIYDLTAMRYGLASLVAVPLCLYYKPWRGLKLIQIAVISFILGPVYILCVFSGFRYAPAAHGGIFMNGVLPIISILFGIVLFRVLPGVRQVLGAALILVSAIVLAWDGAATSGHNAWIGDLLFVIGAFFFASYVLLSERWKLGAMQVIFCGTVVNAVLYLPIWVLWLPSGLAQAPLQPLLLQAVYQGFVPNLIGLIFIAHAARRIGNSNTSSILAAVPGVGGLLGALILGENLSLLSTLAIGLLTIGLLTSVRRKKPSSA